jgi:large subunit ribosomal protein L25
MQQFEITAEKRVDQGKGASRRLRRAGKVPGILYGADKAPQSIQVGNTDMLLRLEHEAFYSHILTLKLDGASERVVMRDLQRHPYKAYLLHIDLLRVDEKQKLTMRIPLHFLNQEICPGVKTNGGVLSHLMSEVQIRCLPKDLPEYIAVDVGAMDIGDTLHLAELKLPPGVEAAEDPEHAVVSCHIPRVIEEPVAEAAPEAAAAEGVPGTEGAAAGAAAPAAGAAAPAAGAKADAKAPAAAKAGDAKAPAGAKAGDAKAEAKPKTDAKK